MFHNIIFPIDIADKNSWLTVFPSVLDLAKQSNAKITVMTVVQDYGMGMLEEYFPKGWIADVTNKSKTALSKIIADNVKDENVQISQLVAKGVVYKAILNTAEKSRADLIILSANRPELSDYLLGPNAAKVVRHAKISVLVVRN